MGAQPVLTASQTARVYTEYQAWLQTGGVGAAPVMRLVIGEGVPAIAAEECIAGMERLYGSQIWSRDAQNSVSLSINKSIPAEGYRLAADGDRFVVEGADENGLLYGVFALLLKLGTGVKFESINEQSAPAVARRVVNHWDNIGGDIERGYAGESIFFHNGKLSYDPVRVRDYARLLATVGINVIVINNVNVKNGAANLIADNMLPQVAEIAAIFRLYGIRLALSVHFESPIILGKLDTADPLSSEVSAWWKERTDEVYRHIPDLSGYLVKADSEFQGGPNSMGRTQAEGANVLARALAPHGGVAYWRCFIYNCLQDWRDVTVDRPKAAYDLFKSLDGKFDSNVILQVKNGPSDFQVREPNSPLLGAMEHTRQALELQITQEYTGQQIDLYNLAVQWEEVFAANVDGQNRLCDIMGGKIDSIAAVSNVGDDENWTGHTLAQANLFAYGRLAWNPGRKAADITREWVRLTFGCEPEVVESITGMMMRSRGTYEKYNAPLGIGWMVNINHHYGPSPEGYEYMKWGTYHRADTKAIGVDRTDNGTGFANQYPAEIAALYNNIKTCPEEFLLFFHRLSYDFKIKNGKTLLQHIYDTHFEGVEDVEDFIRLWDALEGKLPIPVYLSVKRRLELQLENAKEWRDVINTYFYRKTGTPDERGRTIF